MAAENGRTGFEWMDTAFSWLISNHNFARLVSTLCGFFGFLSLIGQLDIYFSGSPRLDTPFMPMYRHGLAFCWLDPNPTPGFLLSIALLTIPMMGTALVWLRPRFGFLISAIGWVVLWSSPFLHSHPGEDRVVYDWRSTAVFSAVLLWLIIAAIRIKARNSPVPSMS